MRTMMTSSPARLPLRKKLVAALMLPALLVLGGCMKIDAAYELHSNNTLDARFSFIDKTGGNLLGEDGMSGCDELQSEVSTSSVGFTVDAFTDDEGRPGCLMEARGVPMDSLDPDDGATITREGDVFTFYAEGSDDPSEGDAETPPGLEMEVTMAVTFPGKVIDAGGGVVSEDGRTVTWSGDAAMNEMRATGNAEAPSNSILLWATLALLVAALAAGGIVVIRKSRGASDPGSGDDGDDGGSGTAPVTPAPSDPPLAAASAQPPVSTPGAAQPSPGAASTPQGNATVHSSLPTHPEQHSFSALPQDSVLSRNEALPRPAAHPPEPEPLPLPKT